jgi:ribosomal protein S18 acetylase RimI-like enzyme
MAKTVATPPVQSLVAEVSRAKLPRDEQTFLEILNLAFGKLEHLPRIKSDLSQIDPKRSGFFIAANQGLPVGCIGATNLPRENWYCLRYLGVKNSFSNQQTANKLVEKAIEHVESMRSEYLAAVTPDIQPYVDVYKRFGFRPTRRWLRIAWDLSETFTKRAGYVIKQLSEHDAPLAGEMIMEAHLPYWDWWFEERGGKDVEDWLPIFGFPDGTWLGSIQGDRITSLAGFTPDAYGQGEARLECFCVSPEFRGQGIGATLLSETISRAKTAGQDKLVIYTFAYLESLPPGATTYMKSGARIEGEYLQLLRN